MNREERAKQFLPFDALKGLREALKAKEEKLLLEEKRELSEEQTEELSDAIAKAEKGATVEITFFFNGRYISLTDKLTDKKIAQKYLTLGKGNIFFDDIYSLKILKTPL